VSGIDEITGLLIARPDPWHVLETIVSSGVRLLAATAVAVVLRDPRERLSLAISSDERLELIQLISLASVEGGPCARGVDENTMVQVSDLTDVAARNGASDENSRRLASTAVTLDVRGLGVFPLRLDHHAVGGLVTLWSRPGALSHSQETIGQTLADLAVLGLVQERDARRTQRLAERALATLNDRAQLLQAVGIIAATLQLSPDDAHDLLRTHSRRTHRTALHVARELTSGELDPHVLSAHS
jgi:ANTAR domain-containing protein